MSIFLTQNGQKGAIRSPIINFQISSNMMTVVYSQNTPDSLRSEVEERLQNLALVYQKEEKEILEEQIVLRDDKEYVGKEAVFSKLDDLEQEMKSWWYCAC